MFVCVFLIGMDTLYIAKVLNTCKWNIRHAKLLALIDIRCTLHKMQTCRKHFSRCLSILPIIAKAGYDSRLIMVAPVQAIPCLSMQLCLPFGQYRFQFYQIHPFLAPLAAILAVKPHVLKLKDHIKFFPVKICIFFRFFHRHPSTFPNGHKIIF